MTVFFLLIDDRLRSDKKSRFALKNVFFPKSLTRNILRPIADRKNCSREKNQFFTLTMVKGVRKSFMKRTYFMYVAQNVQQ